MELNCFNAEHLEVRHELILIDESILVGVSCTHDFIHLSSSLLVSEIFIGVELRPEPISEVVHLLFLELAKNVPVFSLSIEVIKSLNRTGSIPRVYFTVFHGTLKSLFTWAFKCLQKGRRSSLAIGHQIYPRTLTAHISIV